MPPRQSTITSHFQLGPSSAGPSVRLRRPSANLPATRHKLGEDVDSDDLDTILLGPVRRPVGPARISMTQTRSLKRVVYSCSDEGSAKDEDEKEEESDREERRQGQKAFKRKKERKEEGEREEPVMDEDADMIWIPTEVDRAPSAVSPPSATTLSSSANPPAATPPTGLAYPSSTPTSPLPPLPSPPPPPTRKPPSHAPRPPTTYSRRRSPQRPPPALGASSSIPSSSFSIEVPSIPQSKRAMYQALALGQVASSPAIPEAESCPRRSASGEVEDGIPVGASRPRRAVRTSGTRAATNDSRKVKSDGSGKENITIVFSDAQSESERSTAREDLLSDISLDQPERFSIKTRLREHKETGYQKELRRLAKKRRGEADDPLARQSDEEEVEKDEGESEGESEEESEEDGDGRGRRGGGSSSSSIRQFTPAPRQRSRSARKQRAKPKRQPPHQKQSARRPRHRFPLIVDPDEEESATASPSTPSEEEQAETEEEKDMVEALRMDSPERFQIRTRLRNRRKETVKQKQLRKLRAKREGKVVETTDEDEDSDQGVDEAREGAEEGLTDMDGEGGSPQYVGSDEDLPPGPSGDDDSDDDAFIDDTEDAGPLPDGLLPGEFSLTRQSPEFKFKVVFHYLLFLVIRKGKALSLSPRDRMYFIPPLKDLRRKIEDYKSSGVRSQVWNVKLVRALETFPFFEAKIIDAKDGCDACRISGRSSKWQVYLKGNTYDHASHEVLEESTEDDSDDDDDGMEDDSDSSKMHRSLLMGRNCKVRTQLFHEMSHWEHLLYVSIRQRYHNLLCAKGRGTPVDAGLVASASEDEDEDDNREFTVYQRCRARGGTVTANKNAVVKLVKQGNLPERTKDVDEVMDWMDGVGYVKNDFEWFEGFHTRGRELERNWKRYDD